MKEPKDTDGLSDHEIIARTLWGEARSEGCMGMIAVANVIVNRSNDPRSWRGRTLRDICLKHAQFPAWNTYDPNRQKLLLVTTADPIYAEARDIAKRAIDGSLVDLTGGATHYHTRAVIPNWFDRSKRVATIGARLFYKGIA